MRSFGLNLQEGIAQTGVVVLIAGKNPTEKIIALRGDIDALPITEANDVEYKSQNKGVMRACGHYVHTASVPGTAKILNETKGQWKGMVKLIFQFFNHAKKKIQAVHTS